MYAKLIEMSNAPYDFTLYRRAVSGTGDFLFQVVVKVEGLAYNLLNGYRSASHVTRNLILRLHTDQNQSQGSTIIK